MNGKPLNMELEIEHGQGTSDLVVTLKAMTLNGQGYMVQIELLRI